MNTVITTSKQEISLENCDKEPVHIPGHIQNFAVCLATDSTIKTITHCSDNTEPLFGISAKDILGKPLKEIFHERVLHDINNALSLSTSRTQRERATQWQFGDKEYEIWVHFSELKYPVLEIEEIQQESFTQFEVIGSVRALLARITRTDDYEKSLSDAVEGLRSLSGYDRVMLYQFDGEGNGEIIAEAKSAGQNSLFGLRFPSWDIPQQAREIMKVLPLRVLANIHAASVPLLRDRAISDPLNLTFAACRGLSPIHTEYLKNMGVSATMTLSIVVGGELWGMFAFHHSKPRLIGAGLRGAAELFAQFYAMQLEQHLSKKRNTARAVVQQYQKNLFTSSNSVMNWDEIVDKQSESLCDLLDADGLAIVTNSHISRRGVTPPADVIRNIAITVSPDPDSLIASTDNLQKHGIDALPCAGVLTIPIDTSSGNSLLFFREESIRSVTWAGAPEKHIVDEGHGLRLKPRGSFAAYAQKMKGKSRPWEIDTLNVAKELSDTITNLELLNKNDRRRTIYIDELNHRVRNILALIRSLTRKTQENSTSLESYVKALENRISALGAAHDLAANRIDTGIEINRLIKTEVEPFLNPEHQQLTISGRLFVMRSDIAPIFSLIIHELVTNCVKHGALSASRGKIEIDIEESVNCVNIFWKESGGPKVTDPETTGFGLGLIANSIPYELNGESIINFAPEGLQVTLSLPADLLKEVTNEIPEVKFRSTSTTTNQLGKSRKKALVVEDSMMVAIDTSDMLAKIGFDEIEKCATVAKASVLLKSFVPDFAVLDISLKTETSYDIADILIEKSIPFCFATGYGSQYSMPERFKSVTILSKPIEQGILASAIEDTTK